MKGSFRTESNNFEWTEFNNSVIDCFNFLEKTKNAFTLIVNCRATTRIFKLEPHIEGICYNLKQNAKLKSLFYTDSWQTEGNFSLYFK